MYLTLAADTIPCRMCGGPAHPWVRYDLAQFQPRWRQDGIGTTVEVTRCATHGSWFTRDVPNPSALASQYQVSSQTDYYADERRSPTLRNQRLLKQLRRSLPLGSRVCDVGGGDGSFAIAAQRAGYRASLLEVGDLDTVILEAEGVTLLRAFGPDDAGQFDAITLWDVYEHVWPHDAFLAPLHAALRPGGRLLLEVPSPSHLSWPFLALGALLQSPSREIAWSHLVSFTHVQLMTPSELAATLPRYGFAPLEIQTLSELAYQGAEYAERLLPKVAAQWVGALFDAPRVRRTLLGDNKTFVVAEKV